MQALRHIQTTDNDSISIKIPRAFQKRKIEIIVIPISDKVSPNSNVSSWPRGFFEKTAGCFAGDQIVREEQGEYEARNEIR